MQILFAAEVLGASPSRPAIGGPGGTAGPSSQSSGGDGVRGRATEVAIIAHM
jgi:hypothetical protein